MLISFETLNLTYAGHRDLLCNLLFRVNDKERFSIPYTLETLTTLHPLTFEPYQPLSQPIRNLSVDNIVYETL